MGRRISRVVCLLDRTYFCYLRRVGFFIVSLVFRVFSYIYFLGKYVVVVIVVVVELMEKDSDG